MTAELSIIVPTHGRSAKLRTLMSGIASTPRSDHEALEVVVVVDGRDEAPLAEAAALPGSMRFVGLTKDHAGPAAARNHAIRRASGRWVLFFDDDARVDEKTISGHLQLIRRDPAAGDAHLGRVDWPAELLDSRWRILLAESSMLFFWDKMRSGEAYGFRHFWTTNLSVRRENILAVGGFDEKFPSAIHEDIELGWRLARRFGTRVRVDTSVQCLHDHPLGPRDYFLREHKSGRSAAAARAINPAFHAEVWGWIENSLEPQVASRRSGRSNRPRSGQSECAAGGRYGALENMLATLRKLFDSSARQVLDLLEAWAEPSALRPGRDEMHATYLAHLPLKRLFFLQGYLDRPFEDLWAALRPG